jgi:hypothetical protein
LLLFPFLKTAVFATSCVYGKKFKVHQVCGRVEDKDGATIPNASISLNKPESSEVIRQISSDKEGNFQFDEMQSGEYELRVKYAGFWDAAQPFVVSHPAKLKKCSEPIKVVMQLAGSCSSVEKLKR